MGAYIMKKLLAVLIAVGIILGIGGITVLACGYVDNNNDGICDNYPICHHVNDDINYSNYQYYGHHGHHGHHCH